MKGDEKSMSKSKFRRTLSILLAGLMVTSAGTVTAMAAEPDGTLGPIKEYFSIGPRSVGLAIENIPEFAEYDEDFELDDEDGDGIYEGEFRNLISDFPDYDEVSFRIRLDGEWNDCWGAANEDGYTYGSETPVTVKIKDGETLKVSFDASNGEDYRHWTVSAYTTLSLDPEYEQLYIYAGDPEEDSAYIPLKDEDGDHIYEGYAEDFMLYGYNFVVNFEMIEDLNWYSDGNGNTQFGYGYTFKNGLDEGEGYKFYFDTNDPDYHNWHLPYTDGITFATASSTAGLGENQTDIPVQVENDSDNIYISFDTTTGDLRTWLPIVEAGYRIESDELWAWFDGGEAEMTDQNGDGIFEGVFDYLEPGTYEFGIGANGDVWGPPNAEGITMNNEDTCMVELTVEEGEYVYVTFDTTGGNCEKYAVTYEVRKPGQALENRSTLGPDVCYAGDIIDVYGQAIGGTEPYKFKYSVVHVLSGKVMPTPEGFVSDRKITVKLTEYGEYDVKVQVMDADGNTTPDDYLMEAVALERPLENKSYTIPGSLVSAASDMKNTSVINSDKVQIGDKVRIAASANGGTAPYTYAYYYKRSTNASWKKLGTEWGTNTSVAFAPTAAADYDIKVAVKDSTGQIVEKTFTVTAVEELELTNVSAINCSTLKVGGNVKLTGKAVGGKAPYTYSFAFKRSTNTNFKTIGTPYSGETTAKVKPLATGEYDFRVIVKDDAGTRAAKTFKVKVV